MPKPENIEPYKWKKGQSGNPKGRPKLPPLKEVFAEKLSEASKGKITYEQVVEAMIVRALNGDVRAAELVFDRAWSPVKQSMDIDANINQVIMPKSIKQAEEPEDGNN